ncbi:50S ribosomal protein L6 [Terrihabitans sp. B22-R8]|uniref:50S ribosomal protein L6 n=1 Tax=Terrihabitans sp. B22-R8 TaxID=3425128 RepID=UPI00403C5D89
MSRIGKKAITVPQGATATVDGQLVRFKGPKGELSFTLHEDIEGTLEDGSVKVTPRAETKRARSQWGLSRSMVQNLATGVTSGFEKKLEIEGVGYRASVQGKNLVLALGYSHDVIYPIPDGITITATKPTELTVAGINKQQVGQVAAEIREWRPPEPYKGKGVRYAGEFIFRKEGKKK